MGPVALRGVAPRARRVPPNGRTGICDLSSCCSDKPCASRDLLAGLLGAVAEVPDCFASIVAKSSNRAPQVRGCAGADRLGTLVLLPRRNVQPLCAKPLVERPVAGGEPGQVGGVLDGMRVHALAPHEAGAGADVHVPACGPAPLGPLTGQERYHLVGPTESSRISLARCTAEERS